MKNIITILLVSFFLFSSCIPDDSSIVTYNVSCSEPGFNVLYLAGTRTKKSIDVSSSNWEFEYEGTPNESFYVSAKSLNESSSITVEVYFNGILVDETTSTGDYSEATLSGRFN